jgi:hypothetical protein
MCYHHGTTSEQSGELPAPAFRSLTSRPVSRIDAGATAGLPGSAASPAALPLRARLPKITLAEKKTGDQKAVGEFCAPVIFRGISKMPKNTGGEFWTPSQVPLNPEPRTLTP